jgi:cytochrome c-type biogenesis protein CcmH/NrfG
VEIAFGHRVRCHSPLLGGADASMHVHQLPRVDQGAERSVELDPDSPAAWDTLAELRALTTDWSGALDAVERARALPGADAATLNAKAEAYRAARDAAPRAESP